MKNISILAITGMLAVVACNKPQEQPSDTDNPGNPAAASANELPAMRITLVDSTQLSASNLHGKTVIVMFQPDCDHCQREAKQIQENIGAFKSYQVYFVSSATGDELLRNLQANINWTAIAIYILEAPR